MCSLYQAFMVSNDRHLAQEFFDKALDSFVSAKELVSISLSSVFVRHLNLVSSGSDK